MARITGQQNLCRSEGLWVSQSLLDHCCGIYLIHNQVSGKCYVGSSVHVGKRIRDHVLDLRGNRHHSALLQRAWNKYGESVFEFVLLTECSIEELIFLEQAAMDTLCSSQPEFGYNVRPKADRSKMAENTKRLIGLATQETFNTRYPQELQSSIVEMYLSGVWIAEIVRRTSLSRGTIERVLRKRDISWDPNHRYSCRDFVAKNKHSEETRKKIGIKSKGRRLSERSRNKIRIKRLGTKASEETRRKMREGHRRGQ